MKGDIQATIIFTAFVLFAIVVFLWGFGFFDSVFHGITWENSKDDIKKVQNEFYRLEAGEAKKVRVAFGDSVESAFFMNKEDFFNNFGGVRSSIEDAFTCTGDDYKSMMAIVLRGIDSPNCGASVASQDPKKIGDCARYLLGFEQATYCISLVGTNSTFADNTILTIPKKGQRFCFTLEKLSETNHKISYEEIEDDDQCPEEKTTRLIDIV